MARKDLLIYFTQVENQYLEMLEDVKDYEEAHDKGQISDEQYFQAMDMIKVLKENYERLAYVMFLLNAPRKDSKKSRYNNQNKKLIGALVNSSQEHIINENADILKRFKEQLKKGTK